MLKIDFGGIMKINTVLLNCGSVIAPVNWSTKGVPRPYRLYFIKGGSAYFRAEGEEFLLKKEHFYLFPSSLPFIIRQDDNDRLNHLFYDFIMTPPIVSSHPISAGIYENCLYEKFLPIMEETVLNYVNDKTHKNRERASAVLDSFLSIICTDKIIKQLPDNDILKGIEYIEANFDRQITIKEVAERVFLNEDYFIRKFKKNMGVTPYAYLSSLRKNIAAELIAGGMSIKDAAYSVGFQCATSLSHAMKK